MAESDLEKCLPRLRRLALCLFGNSAEGDEAVVHALEKLTNNVLCRKDDESIVKFLFSKIIASAFDTFDENESEIKVNLADVNSHSDIAHNATVIKAVSELDVTERSVVALHVLEQFDEAETAHLLLMTVPDVLKALRSARSHLSQQVSLSDMTSQNSLSL